MTQKTGNAWRAIGAGLLTIGGTMGLIGWIVLGALAYWLASLINKTNREQGWIGNIVLGIVGALVGGPLGI